MDKEIYELMAKHDQTHWWFRARRLILKGLLDSMALKNSSKILDIGCGTGENLVWLNHFGDAQGIEMNPLVADLAQKKGYAVKIGWLPDAFLFAPQKFDLILMADVLEHIEEEYESLLEVRSALAGKLIITVPAFPFLWSAHDEYHQHQRRYTRKTLQSSLESAGFKVERISYFNSILFLPAALFRLLRKSFRIARVSQAELQTPPKLINHLFFKVFMLDKFLLRFCNLPFGLSLLAVCEVGK